MHGQGHRQPALGQFFLGIYTFLALELARILPVPEVVVLLHPCVGLAILSQASSTATTCDMWVEREFRARGRVGYDGLMTLAAIPEPRERG